MPEEKVAAIVPALNEEANVGNVLKVLSNSSYFDEVILVDDGSTDKTSEIGQRFGAKVVKISKIGGSGKGNAMRQGVKATDADIIVFFDADLVGLSESHISLLVEPMLKNDIAMCIGIRGRWGGLPRLIVKMDSLMAIGGERAMKKSLFEKIPEEFMQGFSVETTLNYYCLVKSLSVHYVALDNLRVVIKEKKWGFFKGFHNRFKMIWQMIKIRFVLVFSKGKF
ncbi:MAG: glycosyltransferase family 2 protein [Candidatus Staskawiczbacteria bacterium]|nr:glycosyltransferase family 2 protein [Candidatus Staskawiczbacteria bacterium]